MEATMKFKIKVIDKMVAESEAVLKDYDTNQRNKLSQTTDGDIDNSQFDSPTQGALDEMELFDNNVEIVEKEISQLRDIPINLQMDKVRFGSLVETDRMTMLVCVPHDNVDVDGELVKGISMAAPIYKKMKDLKEGDHFDENGTKYVIKSIV